VLSKRWATALPIGPVAPIMAVLLVTKRHIPRACL